MIGGEIMDRNDQMENRDRREEEVIAASVDFTAPEILYQELIQRIRSYHPSADISMIEKAYHLANNAHKVNYVNPESLILFILSVSLIY